MGGFTGFLIGSLGTAFGFAWFTFFVDERITAAVVLGCATGVIGTLLFLYRREQ